MAANVATHLFLLFLLGTEYMQLTLTTGKAPTMRIEQILSNIF